ncbi:MarR family winged helix-turn-helix transcriptional regulator [Streptomyces sp. CA-106131]|uniref:MarR family winged helix-turn-helix transcriptional regulator n=1 Tax=Streptomyces sp. CA-106131 TaxID=3240045 RepID=UPI003D92A843
MTPSAPSPLGSDHEQAWRVYLRAHALLERQLDSELRAECGISLNVYDALVQLSEAPGRHLRMKDLAEALVYSQSGLTRVVDSLERLGFARRETDPSDRRALLVTLTPEGLKALLAAWKVHTRGVTNYWARHVTPAQARTIGKAFGAVRAQLEPSWTPM